jgi:hypothetical protein
VAAPVSSGRWCTTCADYVRPGTHGIHVMSWTGGERDVGEADPETSDVLAVAFVVLALAGTGVLLFAAALFIGGQAS